ncbi:hypothetical protein ABIA39_007190 [Nocardia sp. GAS34]|uniref:hypothetical protein n=1 Tax=unclassified Nocardia TaxID=2637762 RepID=UPI003D1F0A9A
MDQSELWATLRTRWGRRPLEVIESPLAVGVDESLIWKALVDGASNRERYPDFTLRVTLDNHPLAIDAEAAYLPVESDTGLDGYLKRIDDQSGSSPWSVAASGIHTVSSALWDRARDFANDVRHELGVQPLGHVDMDIFMGHYQSTSVGIHQDFAHNFSFTLRGPKYLLTWPSKMGNKIPKRTLNYDSIRESATVLHGVPGGMTYFPSDEFHIGESPTRPTVAVNFALFETQNSVSEAMYSLQQVVEPPTELAPSTGDGTSINPAAVRAIFAQLAQALDSGAAERAATARWMTSMTSFQLDVERPGADVPAADSDRVGLRPEALLVFADDPTDKEQLLVSSQGYVAAVSNQLSVVTWLQEVAAGVTYAVSGIPEDCAALHNLLVDWGALDAAS